MVLAKSVSKSAHSPDKPYTSFSTLDHMLDDVAAGSPGEAAAAHIHAAHSAQHACQRPHAHLRIVTVDVTPP